MAGSWLAASMNNNVLGGDGDDDDDGWMGACAQLHLCALPVDL
jgi:hypothetical protein